MARNRRKSVLNQLLDLTRDLPQRTFLVGGCVRDIIMDRQPTDFDLAVEGEIEPLVRLLSRQLGVKPVRHSEFGTATFECGREQVDLARTRTETYFSAAVLPRVSFGSFDIDLKRRDFTINAIAVSLSGPDFGLVHDPCGGQADIRRRLIRILHERSFIDDPTRIFRAFRYRNRLGFCIEPRSERLLRSAVKRNMIGRLSGQRLLNEYRLIFSEPSRMGTLDDLRRHRIIRFPDSERQVIDRLGKAGLYYLLGLIDARALPLTQVERKMTSELSRGRKICRRLARARPNSRIHRILSGLSTTAVGLLPAIDPRIAAKISKYRRLRRVKPLVDGHDLQRLGIPAGPRYRILLDRLYGLQLDKKIRTKRAALALVKNG